jgi:hypothetical protein
MLLLRRTPDGDVGIVYFHAYRMRGPWGSLEAEDDPLRRTVGMYQTQLTSTRYGSNFRSDVTMVRPSVTACAMRRRSNGSL